MIKSVAAFAVLALASAMPAHAQGNAYPLGLNWSSGWSGYGRPIVSQTVIVQVGDRKSSQVVSVEDNAAGPRAVPLGINTGAPVCEQNGGVYLCTYR